jgi:DNA-binding transcriptional MocR family regulator
MEIDETLQNWAKGTGPLYQRLEAALRRAIDRAEIIPGSKLAPERDLARALSISRATVTQAYDLLRQTGYAESRQGSGTWVTSGQTLARQSPGTLQGSGGNRRMPASGFFDRLVSGSDEEPIDLSLAALPGLEEVFRVAASLSFQELPTQPPGGYAPLGLPALRTILAGRYERAGAPTEDHQILVTSGAQQAISLLATCYLQRGDPVVVESPTYPGAIEAFNRQGARLIPVPLSPQGVDIVRLRETVASVSPRLIYLMPTFQNPTGAVIPEAERSAIVEIADQFQVPVVEDNTVAELSFGVPTPPSLAYFGPSSRVISVGSMSKLYWGGLRVGWIRASEESIFRLGQLKVIDDLGSSLIPQAIACKLLPDNDAAVDLRSAQLRPRLRVLDTLLRERIPEWSWERPLGGLSIWVKTPLRDAGDFVRVALRSGVAVSPGVAMSPEGRHTEFLRISLVVDEPALTEAVDRLAEAWDGYRWSSGRASGVVGVPI